MGLKRYEQEIAAAAAHPDREHAVTVLESLARSLRRHEWPAERRAAAYDLALYCEATARRMIAAGARCQLEESAAICRHPAAKEAMRERMAVHVGCGGEVTRSAVSLHWDGPTAVDLLCDGCARAIDPGDVVEPGDDRSPENVGTR